MRPIKAMSRGVKKSSPVGWRGRSSDWSASSISNLGVSSPAFARALAIAAESDDGMAASLTGTENVAVSRLKVTSTMFGSKFGSAGSGLVCRVAGRAPVSCGCGLAIATTTLASRVATSVPAGAVLLLAAFTVTSASGSGDGGERGTRGDCGACGSRGGIAFEDRG